MKDLLGNELQFTFKVTPDIAKALCHEPEGDGGRQNLMRRIGRGFDPVTQVLTLDRDVLDTNADYGYRHDAYSSVHRQIDACAQEAGYTRAAVEEIHHTPRKA